MADGDDGEHQHEYKALDMTEVTAEEEGLLAELEEQIPYAEPKSQRSWSCWSRFSESRFGVLHLGGAFAAGIIACIIGQFLFVSYYCPSDPQQTDDQSLEVLAPTHVGSTQTHAYPPISPTNAYPTLFPTDVGYAGPTPTGDEPALIVTGPSYPSNTVAPNLIAPASLWGSKKPKKGQFDLFKKWGNLSPWYSVDRGAFGIDSSPDPPEGCAVTGLHFLHRHGARYPTSYASYGGPANFSSRLHASASKWNGSGDLEFMNDWTYKLGEEVLTPFGRQQLYDLGVSLRMKYGYLLKNFTESNTIPVFRTESQHRMLHSALNFAIGFFGYPIEDMYQQSITIEEEGFNNTLAPYKTCPNAHDPKKADRGVYFVDKWAHVYLKDAHARLAPQMKGYNLTIEDTYIFQQLCAYETVALGYSKFCELFTEEEWEGFDYALDLYFWYDSAFGSPLARVLGIGYVQELVARLTHTPIAVHNSSTNATLDDNEITFPLNQSLYVDATHEVVVLHVLTALNLTNFARSGPLPTDHIPANLSFKTSQLSPFATNVQFQLLSCSPHTHTSSSSTGEQIRIIINDAVSPLTSLAGCPPNPHGMCSLETFVEAQREMIRGTDWEEGCYGGWEVEEGEGWSTTRGEYPKAKDGKAEDGKK